MITGITNTIRTYYTGRNSSYVFRRSSEVKKTKIDSVNLYIHIPFCRNVCPYCPYFKVRYDAQKAAMYKGALLKEVDSYYKLFGRFDVSSVYIGGGTPTLLIDELSTVLESIGIKFNVKGDICVEISPGDITDELITKLKLNNVALVSAGVQSFADKHLRFIGRNYSSSVIESALTKLNQANFKSVNIDLLFALPGQSLEDVLRDLEKAIESGVSQVTAYPLFTFPYTSIGKFLKLKHVKMPDLATRQKHYYRIYEFLTARGFKRVSVWGFKKGEAPRYSSVTRDNYIGLGAGAGSHLPDGFYLNTFSVEEYIKKCSSFEFPTALFMDFTEDMSRYFWLYWRFYDTYINKDELVNRFGPYDTKLNGLLSMLRRLGLIQEKDACYELTKRGSFWIHLLQNYFSLRYINKVWGTAMKDPYPFAIAL